MKFQRQLKILELVENSEINTQEELSERLKALGFDVTQATVSRDIKELRLVKTLTQEGKYRYVAGAREPQSDILTKFRTILKESVVKVDFAMNIVVIKTLSGMAMAAAEVIDNMTTLDVVGSIAGDNTILLIARTEQAALKLAGELGRMMK